MLFSTKFALVSHKILFYRLLRFKNMYFVRVQKKTNNLNRNTTLRVTKLTFFKFYYSYRKTSLCVKKNVWTYLLQQ